MFSVQIIPHSLEFKFPAGTSRGVLHQKTSWFLLLEAQGIMGIGEAGPLPGLSPDDRPDFAAQLRKVGEALQACQLPQDPQQAEKLAEQLASPAFPSIRFALETALLDWVNGGRRQLFDNDFSRGRKAIPINGLIWMGDKEGMRQRIGQKIDEGYHCLKMKIGAIDFEQECALLAAIRKDFSAEQISLRVDANGAFSPKEALWKLEQLSRYKLHSIEQPVKAGQPDLMHDLCRQSPVPIALDEELIGLEAETAGDALLKSIQPQYIILKPGLLGGFSASRRWIELAEKSSIGWWVTSALESNIGLNAISQFTGGLEVEMPQGLGTGQLYHNNISSPLCIKEGTLTYEQGGNWDIDILKK